MPRKESHLFRNKDFVSTEYTQHNICTYSHLDKYLISIIVIFAWKWFCWSCPAYLHTHTHTSLCLCVCDACLCLVGMIIIFIKKYYQELQWNSCSRNDSWTLHTANTLWLLIDFLSFHGESGVCKNKMLSSICSASSCAKLHRAKCYL